MEIVGLNFAFRGKRSDAVPSKMDETVVMIERRMNSFRGGII